MKYVSVGRRFIAILIDTIILGVVGAPFIHYHRTQTLSGSTSYGFEIHGAPFIGLLALTIAYYAVMEGSMGASVGKLAMGIRVVQEDGSKCTWQGAILRNLLRIIDGFFFYIVGALLVWSSPTRQRLGDRVGSTVVILKGTNRGMPSDTMSASTMNWPTPAQPGSPPIPPPPPMPPMNPPPSAPPPAGPSDQPMA